MFKSKSVTVVLIVVTLCLFLTPAAFAGDKITWQSSMEAKYNTSIPGTILPYNDGLYAGGLDLNTGKMTSDKDTADIAIDGYGDYIGSRDIIDLGEVDFDSVDTVPTDGYSFEAKAAVSHVYIVSTDKGEYAKVLIKSKLSSSINLKYAIIGERVVDKSKEIAGTLDAVEGLPITIRLTEYISQAYNYEIYRSDNGGDFKSLTDFKLSEPEFTDKYILEGHTYLYKFYAYDKSGKLVYKSQMVKAVVSKKPANRVIVLQLGSTNASVNGKATAMSVAPVYVDGRTLVPLRFIAEALGAQVDWEGTERRITISLNNEKVVVWIDNSEARVNGETQYMDVPPQILDGSTMVPVRFISESLKQKVDYESSTKTITITSLESTGGTTTGNTGGNTAPKEEDLSYFFNTWRMVVSGTVNSLPVESGKLKVNSDGTYEWDSTWEGKILTGSWTRSGDSGYPITLMNGEDGKSWGLGKTSDGGIIIWEGSIWKNGYHID